MTTELLYIFLLNFFTNSMASETCMNSTIAVLPLSIWMVLTLPHPVVILLTSSKVVEAGKLEIFNLLEPEGAGGGGADPPVNGIVRRLLL